MTEKHSIKIKNKTYFYSIKKNKDGSIRVRCEGAKMNQDFLAEDVPSLLIDLPALIKAEQKYVEKQNEVIRFRLSGKEKTKIEKKATEKGYSSVSKYLRDLALS